MTITSVHSLAFAPDDLRWDVFCEDLLSIPVCLPSVPHACRVAWGSPKAKVTGACKLQDMGV